MIGGSRTGLGRKTVCCEHPVAVDANPSVGLPHRRLPGPLLQNQRRNVSTVREAGRSDRVGSQRRQVMSVLAAAHAADLGVLFVILAVLAFAVAVYLAYIGNFVGAVAAALVGVIILVVA